MRREMAPEDQAATDGELLPAGLEVPADQTQRR